MSFRRNYSEQQQIETCNGCPNNCGYCYEPIKYIAKTIPTIVNNQVQILDMNFLYNPNALDLINFLGSQKVNNKVVYYELVCGVDFRRMNQKIADAFKQNRFIKMRFAWDYGFEHQYKIKDTLNMFIKAGYKPKQLSVFMVCNWKIPYDVCLKKLDLLKIWNVKVNDCYYDNQLSPYFKPIEWTLEQMKDFRRRCRKHNQMILFGIDPEFKVPKPTENPPPLSPR